MSVILCEFNSHFLPKNYKTKYSYNFYQLHNKALIAAFVTLNCNYVKHCDHHHWFITYINNPLCLQSGSVSC